MWRLDDVDRMVLPITLMHKHRKSIVFLVNIVWFVLPQCTIASSNCARCFDETLGCVGENIHTFTQMLPDVAEQFHMAMCNQFGQFCVRCLTLSNILGCIQFLCDPNVRVLSVRHHLSCLCNAFLEILLAANSCLQCCVLTGILLKTAG